MNDLMIILTLISMFGFFLFTLDKKSKKAKKKKAKEAKHVVIPSQEASLRILNKLQNSINDKVGKTSFDLNNETDRSLLVKSIELVFNEEMKIFMHVSLYNIVSKIIADYENERHS